MANRQSSLPDIFRCSGNDHDFAIDAIMDCRVQRNPGTGAADLFGIPGDLYLISTAVWTAVRSEWQGAEPCCTVDCTGTYFVGCSPPTGSSRTINVAGCWPRFNRTVYLSWRCGSRPGTGRCSRGHGWHASTNSQCRWQLCDRFF